MKPSLLPIPQQSIEGVGFPLGPAAGLGWDVEEQGPRHTLFDAPQARSFCQSVGSGGLHAFHGSSS